MHNVMEGAPITDGMICRQASVDVLKQFDFCTAGYARMLRQYLKSTLSPADYSKINWVYAGATNLRYEQLVAGDLDATLLNAPFTSLIPDTVPCQPFYEVTGLIQGTVGNVRRNELYRKQKHIMQMFLGAYKTQTLDMKNNPSKAKAGLAVFYNVTADVASNIYDSLWGPDGFRPASVSRTAGWQMLNAFSLKILGFPFHQTGGGWLTGGASASPEA